MLSQAHGFHVPSSLEEISAGDLPGARCWENEGTLQDFSEGLPLPARLLWRPGVGHSNITGFAPALQLSSKTEALPRAAVLCKTSGTINAPFMLSF